MRLDDLKFLYIFLLENSGFAFVRLVLTSGVLQGSIFGQMIFNMNDLFFFVNEDKLCNYSLHTKSSYSV